MKIWDKNNRLDEMQEQTLLQIESRGFWLTWTGLLIAIAVQMLLGLPFKALVGEWIVFMLSCVYVVVCCLRCGIWDRHLVPNAKAHLLMSAAGGIAVTLLNGFSFGLWFGAAVAGVLTFLLCYAALTLSAALYQKRRRALDEPSSDDKA